MTKTLTLGQFIVDSQNSFPDASGQFSRLLNDLSIAAKIVNRELNKAGLVDILGDANVTNVQGEQVKKLDVFANDQFIAALKSGGECCAIVSEEDEDITIIESEISKNAKYIVCMDPLDGSSNIDVNVPVGTIFAIYKRKSTSGLPTQEDILQNGSEQIAAGYFMYGSSTMMVFTTGKGVNGFTLDPSIGEFCLSNPDMKMPQNGKIYSLNEGNIREYPEQVQKFIAYCQESDKETGRPYSGRYVGSMVADFHRNMLKGGIFIYPSTLKNPNGKLRLVYECNPLAFIMEQAGGIATDGKNRILDQKVDSIHQRTPVYIGSKQMVEKAMGK